MYIFFLFFVYMYDKILFMKEGIKLEKQEKKEITDSKEKLTGKKVFFEILEWIICFVIAYVLYLIINYFFGTISCIRQTSMYPTAIEGERVVIQRSKVFKQELNYGDIVIFEAPLDSYTSFSANIEDVTAKFVEKKGFDAFSYYFMGIGKSEYIKRVIGLPGDHIEVKSSGEVYRNGEKLEESYITDGYTPLGGAYFEVIVPDNCLYLMGDNRVYSKDSRSFGCIPVDKVTGYVKIRIWPFSRFGELRK